MTQKSKITVLVLTLLIVNVLSVQAALDDSVVLFLSFDGGIDRDSLYLVIVLLAILNPFLERLSAI